LGQKKFRNDEGVFIAEGPKIINELLIAPDFVPITVFALKEWTDNNVPLTGQLRSEQLIEIKDTELERISFLTTPNQVVAIFKKPFLKQAAPENKISLVLDGIQDPGNLGTIVRIADWFGIQQVICSPDCADVFNPKTVQSTMGSISRVAVLYEDIPAFINAHPRLPVYAAMLDGKDIYQVGRIKEGLIVIGNESKGISKNVQGHVQHPITIPRLGHAESLNAAVATGIVLSHLV
jgi:RNA methyltransferase, TrmH family